MFNFLSACKGNFNQLPYPAFPPSTHSVLPPAACLPVSDWCCLGNGRVEVSILVLPARLILCPAVCVCFLWPCISVSLNTCLVPRLCSRMCCFMPNHIAVELPMEPKLLLDQFPPDTRVGSGIIMVFVTRTTSLLSSKHLLTTAAVCVAHSFLVFCSFFLHLCIKFSFIYCLYLCAL